MAKKKKIQLLENTYLEYDSYLDLLTIQYVFMQGLLNERKNHHVSLYETYEKVIRRLENQINKEMKRKQS